MNSRFVLLIVFLISALSLRAQDKVPQSVAADSLLKVLEAKKSIKDTVEARHFSDELLAVYKKRLYTEFMQLSKLFIDKSPVPEANSIIREIYEYRSSSFYYLGRQEAQLEESHEMLKRFSGTDQYVHSLFITGQAYLFIGKNDSSVYYYRKGLEAAGEGFSPERIIMAYGNIAFAFMNLEQTDSAVYYKKKTLKYAEKQKDTASIINSYIALGAIFGRTGKHKKAGEYYEEAYVVAEKSSRNKTYLPTITSGIANSRFEQGIFEPEMKQRLLDALDISLKSNMLSAVYEIQFALTTYCSREEDYQAALTYAENSLDIAKRYLGASEVVDIQLMIADTYSKMNRHREALNILNETEKVIQGQKELFRLVNVLSLKAREYKILNKKDSALRTYEYLLKAKDSLNKLQRSELLAEQEAKFETDKKERQNAVLREQTKAQKAVLERNKVQSYALYGGLGALLLIALLLLRARSFAVKNNKTLADKNEEIRNQAEELAQINDKLQEVSRYKESLTAMIVHDLKNPLNTVLNLAANKGVKSAGKKMLGLVQNMLDVQRFQAAAMPLNIRPVNIIKVTEEATKECEVLFEEKSIQVHKQVNLSRMPEADPKLLRRMLVNLLSNAAKYSPESGNVFIHTEEQNEKCVLTVRDEGIGVSEDDKDAVFEQFFQTEAKALGLTASSGLGLSFCKLAAEAQSGSIRVFNHPEGGAVFELIIPLSKQDLIQVTKSDDLGEENINTKSPEEEARIKEVCSRLSETEFYMMSEVRAILDEYSWESPGLSAWNSKLLNALFSGDEDEFNTLIGKQ